MDDTTTSPLDGFSSLLQLAGVAVPARAKFVGAATFSGLYTGTTIGLVCGQLGILFTPFGPILPFLLGSSIGFGLRLYTTWKNAVEMTYIYAHHYPVILAHALWTESRIIVPSSVLPTSNALEENEKDTMMGNNTTTSTSMVDWVKSQGMKDFSFCVLAAQTCQKDVKEVDTLVRQRLVEAKAASRGI